MLGPLRVQRGDGSSVDSREWRTGKTADLLRILAMRAGQPVPADKLLAALWPNSDQHRGQASLRTAVSQIRQVLGRDCVERSLAGLRLRNAWVDVEAFRRLSAEVRRLMSIGDLSRVESIAREADALYLGDLRANDEAAEWVLTERHALANAYQELLCDAADATVAHGFGRDTVDFASRALALDPFSERACRAVMRGHAAMGQTSQALREFEHCRQLLAEELGVDPSQPTRELYLELLRSEPTPPVREDAQPYRHEEQVVHADSAQGLHLSARTTQAESRLQLALGVCLPQRQFTRARRCANEAAGMTDLPAVRARAIIAAWLPDLLLGGAQDAEISLGQAASLAAESGDDLLCRRIEVLRCLVAHDLARPDFDARWAHAAASCESETDVNWAWLMVRIATERGDLDIARLVNRLPMAPAAGPLAQQLQAIASATLLAELGEVDQAIDRLRAFIDAEDRPRAALLLPEALARLIILQAQTDLAAAEDNLVRLDIMLGRERALPREACLRLMAAAAVQAAQSHPAAAGAMAANAAEIAEAHGLVFLAAMAHKWCARYTARARTVAAEGAYRGTPRLSLRFSMVAG
jgi:DNA-binding SARP family transcriptional activator